MIFYETITSLGDSSRPLRNRIPAVYANEAEAKKAFNAAKRKIKKHGRDGDSCGYYKVVASTDLTKQDWMRLFLGDSQGSHLVNDEDVLFVRDLITVRDLIEVYTYPQQVRSNKNGRP